MVSIRSEIKTLRFWLTSVFAGLVVLYGTVMFSGIYAGGSGPISPDAYYYGQMSEVVWSVTEAPYAFRVLSPAIVDTFQGLGLSINSSWFLLTTLASWLLLVTFYLFIRKFFGIQPLLATLLMFSAGFSYWFISFNQLNYWLVDPLGHLLMLLVVAAALLRRPVIFVVLVAVAALNKESALLYSIIYPVLAFNFERPLRKQWQMLAYWALGLVFLGFFYHLYREWALTQIAAVHGTVPVMSYGPGGRSLLETIRFSLTENNGARAIWGVFDFFWVIAGLSLWRQGTQTKWQSPLVRVTVLMLVFAFLGRFLVTDTQRVMAMLTPFVLAWAGVLLQALPSRWALFIILIYVLQQLALLDPAVASLLSILILALLAGPLASYEPKLKEGA